MKRDKITDQSPKGDLRDSSAREVDDVDVGKPGNPNARDQCRLGNFYVESLIYEYAVNAYKQAINFDPNYATAHHNLGVVYYKMGQFDDALAELEIAIRLWSDVPRFYYTKGVILKDAKRLQESIASFSKAISLDSQYTKAHYGRGCAYYYDGNLEKACSDLEEVVRLDPSFRDALYNLGLIYIALARWDDAQKTFMKHLELRPNDPDVFYSMGLIHVAREDDLEKAIENFQKAISIDPRNLKARFELSLLHARMRYRQTSHRKEAIAQLRALIEMYEELGDFDRIHDAFFILGGIYDDEPEDSDLAIEAYKRGLQLVGKSAEVHNNLGVLYSQKGLMDEAVREFREAIKLDPEYESPYHNLAKIYFYSRNEEIVKDFQEWIKEEPEKSGEILFNLSLALIDVGRTEAYESIYSKAHRIKNLIGVAGSKLRRASREIDSNARLMEVLEDQEKCYREMVGMLSTLRNDDLVLTMVDINSTIESVIRQTGFKLEKAGLLKFSGDNFPNIECRLIQIENLPRVKGDQGKLKEAFNNIIINAIEAMLNGGLLKISTKYLESTSEVEITFQDAGVGISNDDLINIFKPGYTTKESGSGFGLSIVERIIKEHKGSINVISSKEKGTTVKIRLPVNLELAPIQTSLRMRPVIYEDPGELISTEVDKIVKL